MCVSISPGGLESQQYIMDLWAEANRVQCAAATARSACSRTPAKASGKRAARSSRSARGSANRWVL